MDGWADFEETAHPDGDGVDGSGPRSNSAPASSKVGAGRQQGTLGSRRLRASMADEEQTAKEQATLDLQRQRAEKRGSAEARDAKKKKKLHVQNVQAPKSAAAIRGDIAQQLSLLGAREPQFGNSLQQRLFALGRAGLSGEWTSDRRRVAHTILFRRRHVGTLATEYDQVGISRKTNMFVRCASALVSLGGMLNGCFLAKLADAVTRPCAADALYKPLLLVKKRRYDETPLKLTVQTDDADDKGCAAKVLQSDFNLLALVQHRPSGHFLAMALQPPTWLQALERNTAEVLFKSQHLLEANLPELDRLGEIFPFSVQLVNTDSYSANFLAEAMLNDRHPAFLKSHKGCDIHGLGSSLSRCFAHVPQHISGMIHGSLAMMTAGSLNSLRRALLSVLEDRLVIRFGPPPTYAGLVRYRAALFELWMPGVANTTDDFSLLSSHSLKMFQRYQTIAFWLNGNIMDANVVEFWTLDRSATKEAVLPLMQRHLIPALLPRKIPLLPRGKWTGHSATLSWYGLVDGHHCLLSPMVQVWLGRKSPIAPPPAAEENEGWASFAGQDPAEAAEQRSEQPQAAVQMGAGEVVDEDGEGEDNNEVGSGWAELNRQMRSDFFNWSTSNAVCVIVVAIGLAIRDLAKLIQRQIRLSGKVWARQQRVLNSQQQPSSYRALEACSMRNIDEFYRMLQISFHELPEAMHPAGFCRSIHALMFRMLCSAGAATHYYLRMVWKAFPIQLFQGLCNNAEKVYQVVHQSRCLLDALSRKYVELYTDVAAMQSDAGQAVLHGLASVYTLDILGIEARHFRDSQVFCWISRCQVSRPST